MADLFHSQSRSARLDQVLGDLLGRTPELQAAAVVSFDGLPMASALPVGMQEDRVAAMSAALLSLGERAAENFGRGTLNQVYVEGENGTVFLVSAQDEAVLVAVGAQGAKVGLLMFEVRRSAVSVADALRADDVAPAVPSWEPAQALDPVDTESFTAVEPSTVPEPEPVALAPVLHVVEESVVGPEEQDGSDFAAEASQTAEPVEAAPGVGDLPLAPSPWGSPLTASRRDASHWTAYDQTSDEHGSWS
jgi:uncharacterized protein